MTKTTQRKLGIIAGGGTLPATLVEFCRQTNLPFFVLALKNHAQPQLLPTNCDIAWIRIVSIGKDIKLLKQNNVTDIVMIGHVRRPSVMELLPDAKGLQLLARIGLNKKGMTAYSGMLFGKLKHWDFTSKVFMNFCRIC